MEKIKNQVVTFHGRKGGIGKTSIMLNVAVELAQRNKKVLIIDADGQGSTTNVIKKELADFSCHAPKWFTLGGKNKEETELYVNNYLLKSIKQSKIPNIDLITGGVSLYEFASDLTTKIGKEKYLGRNLAIAKQSLDYDYIFVDLNPAFDVLAINVYLAANSIIQVVDRSELSLIGLEENMDEWEEKAHLLGAENQIKCILFNKANSGKLSKEMFNALHSLEYSKNKVLSSFLPDNTHMEKSVVSGGKWLSNVKRMDNWKPTKGLEKYLSNKNIMFKTGNPVKNLVDELLEKQIL